MKNRPFLSRISILLVFWTAWATPATGQMNQTFKRMFTTILQEDLFSQGPFRGGFDQAAAIADRTLTPALNSLISSNVSSFPLTSTIAGVSFDLLSGVPELIQESLGPIYAERAETIGRGKLYVGVNTAHYGLSRFRGLATRDFRFTFTHRDVTGDGSLGDFVMEEETIDLFPNLDLQATTVAFYATFGLLGNLDIGFAVPLVDLSISGTSRAVINTLSFYQFGQAVNNFNDDVLNPALTDTFSFDNHARGLGDIALRLKYSFRQQSDLDLAAFLEWRLATGKQSDFLGSGKNSIKISGVISKKIGDFTPHLIAGYEARGADFDSDEIEVIVGFDQKLANGVTFALGFMGEYDLQKKEAISLFPGSQPVVSQVSIQGPGQYTRAVDLSNIPERRSDHVVNISAGVKIAPSDRLIFMLNALVPLNDGGLRSGISPTTGLAMVF